MPIESSSSPVCFRTKTHKEILNGLSAAVACCSLLFAALIAAQPAIAATWFVATNGVNHASRGHIEQQPWKTLSYAALRADPGDIIYVKAGTYGVPNDVGLPQSQKDSDGVVIVDAGVKFIGYHTSWQNLDLDQGQGVPAEYLDFYYPPAQLKPMPEIVGISRSSYTGIQINSPANSVIVKNFRIRNFQTGVLATSSNNTIKNIVASQFGNVDTGGGGRAIWINGGNSNILENCFVLNATDEGISLYHTDFNYVDRCKVFCDDNSTYEPGAMDYYILIVDGNSNDIVDCFIQRLMDPLGNGAPAHGGHGYHIQADTDIDEASQDNWILSCTARSIDEPFSLRGRVTDNKIIDGDSDILISELHKEEGTVYAQGCISIVGGPEDNIFSQTVLRNSKAAIAFFSLVDYDELAPSSGTRNIFENCLFENCKEAIRLSWWNEGNMTKWVTYNKFINCNFIGEYGSIFFLANRVSYGNQLINCIITGFSGYVSGVPGQTLYPLGFSFDHCCFWNPDAIGFPSPPAGSIEEDPLFDDASYNLQPNSQCVDAGTSVEFLVDLDGDPRPIGDFDIGAQEQ